MHTYGIRKIFFVHKNVNYYVAKQIFPHFGEMK